MKFINALPYTSLLIGLLIGGALGAALGYYGQCTSGVCPLTSTWWRGMLYGAFLGGLFAFSSSGARAQRESSAPDDALTRVSERDALPTSTPYSDQK